MLNETLVNFIVANYTWIMIISSFLLMILIGYVADSTDFGRAGRVVLDKKDKDKDESKEIINSNIIEPDQLVEIDKNEQAQNNVNPLQENIQTETNNNVDVTNLVEPIEDINEQNPLTDNVVLNNQGVATPAQIMEEKINQNVNETVAEPNPTQDVIDPQQQIDEVQESNVAGNVPQDGALPTDNVTVEPQEPTLDNSENNAIDVNPQVLVVPQNNNVVESQVENVQAQEELTQVVPASMEEIYQNIDNELNGNTEVEEEVPAIADETVATPEIVSNIEPVEENLVPETDAKLGNTSIEELGNNIIDQNNENFVQEVIKYEQPVVVDDKEYQDLVLHSEPVPTEQQSNINEVLENKTDVDSMDDIWKF